MPCRPTLRVDHVLRPDNDYMSLTYVLMTYSEVSSVTNLQTVVELPEFLRRAKAMMSDDERVALVDYVAANPDGGISLGGGLRKLRVAREGGGKSGGYRTIYVFGGAHVPIFLVTIFAKKEKDNLTRAELVELISMSKVLLARYGG